MFVVRPGLIFIHNDCLKLKTYPLIRYCETMTGCKGKSILPDWIINHDGWLNVSNLPLMWISKHDDWLKLSNPQPNRIFKHVYQSTWLTFIVVCIHTMK